MNPSHHLHYSSYDLSCSRLLTNIFYLPPLADKRTNHLFTGTFTFCEGFDHTKPCVHGYYRNHDVLKKDNTLCRSRGIHSEQQDVRVRVIDRRVECPCLGAATLFLDSSVPWLRKTAVRSSLPMYTFSTTGINLVQNQIN